MPGISETRYAETLRRVFGIRGRDVATTLAPEIVPVVSIDDVSALDLGGFFAVNLAAGGAGFRSEVLIQYFPTYGDARAWLLSIDQLHVTTLAAGAVEVVYGVAFSGFTALNAPTFGDLQLGLGPVNLGTRNNAAATAGTLSYMSGSRNIPTAEIFHELDVAIRLRTFAVAQQRSAVVVRPTADNVGIRVCGRWRLLPAIP